jgi:hypothetical protein
MASAVAKLLKRVLKSPIFVMNKKFIFVVLSSVLISIFPQNSLACDRGDIDDLIYENTFPANTKDGGISVRNVTSSIADKFHLTHNVRFHKPTGTMFYSVRISNGYEYKGATTCSCVVFKSAEDDFPWGSLGGKWGVSEAAGVSGSRIRNEAMNAVIGPNLAQFVDTVSVYAGWCPSDKILRKLEKIALDAAYKAARLYAISKGVPASSIPENAP